MTTGLLFSRGGLVTDTPTEFWQLLCDALFVPGILFASVGGLIFASGEGVFDMLRYGTMKLLLLFRRKEKRDEYPRTYYDYKAVRSEGKHVGTASLLLCGVVFLALAGVALVLYVRSGGM